jgi:hypothetical protein
MVNPRAEVIISRKELFKQGNILWRTPEGRKLITESRDWYRNHKRGCVCEVCGKKWSEDDKDFSYHHKPETIKISDISVMAKNGYTIDELKSEIDKCVCLCRACYKNYKE